MLKEISNLITDGKFVEASEEVKKQLDGSFNFDNENERENFNQLYEYDNKIMLDIFSTLERDILLKNESFRSAVSDTANSQRPIQYDEKYLTHLNGIEEKILLRDADVKKDAFISVLIQPDVEIEEDDNFLAFLSEAGEYMNGGSIQDYPLIYLRGYSKDNKINLKRTVDGLNNALDGLVEDQKENIVIYFPVNWFAISESMLFLTLFSTLISTLLFIINTELQYGKLISIYWVFDQTKIVSLFKKVVAKARIIRVQSQLIEGTINRLKKKAITNNDNYVKQLKTIAHIIDEADVPILLTGETGVGKSFLARIIHEESSRKGKYISVNCSNILDELAESELFGHEKGSFTGAYQKKIGKVEAARGGTLFLDEIDRASKKVRDTLLTFIDTKEFTVVGQTKSSTSDVRLIFGSNKDFKKLIKEKAFEDDFLNRIDERIITIPPLRDRKEDIPSIVDFILDDLNNKKNTDISISIDIISKLTQLPLKGNIRDLNKIIKYGFYEANFHDKYGVISLDQYKDFSFSNNELSAEFYQLIGLAKMFMMNFKFLEDKIKLDDGEKFNLIKNFIMPIFAEIYLSEIYQDKNSVWREQNATSISGSSLDRGNDATIKKRAKEFLKIKNLF